MNADFLLCHPESAAAGEGPAFAFDLNLWRGPLRPPCTLRFSFSSMRTKLLAKEKGEWAEVCFAAEVLRRGWGISRPYGDSSPYDCIVDCAGRISRVQIKSSCAWIKD